jgi:hypothetical protein
MMKKLFTRTIFFWLVIAVFMAISVTQAGLFFGITHSGTAIVIGLAVALFLDLVTVVLMQAQLEARYRGEYRQARTLLLFIVATCGTSTFANLAIALNDFHASSMLPDAPIWVQLASPYVLASFPLFIIMMSIAMDKVVNARPLAKLNAEEYRADEQKRIEILKIQNEHLQIQLEQEQKRIWMYDQSKLQRLQFKAQLEQERFAVKQQRVSTRKAYKSRSLDGGQWTLNTGCPAMDTIQSRVDTGQVELDSVQQAVDTPKVQVDAGHWTEPSEQPIAASEHWTEQTEHNALNTEQYTASGKVKSVQSRKAKQVNTDEHPRIIALSSIQNTVSTGQDTEICEQVRSLLDGDPSISGRAIAARLNISPTTANKWKTMIESEHTGQRRVDSGH